MAEEFSHNESDHRYEVSIDGEFAGEARYTLRGNVAEFDHTNVAEQFGGRGVAGRLVRFAMDDVRAQGEWKVRPACSYVIGWFGKHPEYADLLA